jgi:hypothetical protein
MSATLGRHVVRNTTHAMMSQRCEIILRHEIWHGKARGVVRAEPFEVGAWNSHRRVHRPKALADYAAFGVEVGALPRLRLVIEKISPRSEPALAALPSTRRRKGNAALPQSDSAPAHAHVGIDEREGFATRSLRPIARVRCAARIFAGDALGAIRHAPLPRREIGVRVIDDDKP